jgi:hypothetical protein
MISYVCDSTISSFAISNILRWRYVGGENDPQATMTSGILDSSSDQPYFSQTLRLTLHRRPEPMRREVILSRRSLYTAKVCFRSISFCLRCTFIQIRFSIIQSIQPIISRLFISNITVLPWFFAFYPHLRQSLDCRSRIILVILDYRDWW